MVRHMDIKKTLPFFVSTVLIFLNISPVYSTDLNEPSPLEYGAYNLKETTDTTKDNIITKYEFDYNTGLLTSKYYEMSLNKTEYGHKDINDYADYYAFYKDISSGMTLLEEGNENNFDIVYFENYDSDDYYFLENYNKNGHSYGGALYYKEKTRGDYTADFVGNNSVSKKGYGHGGAIYSQASTTGNIAGDFINNGGYGITSSYGGAIFSSGSKIKNIEGDFIGNFAYTENKSARGGAIYNENGTIEDINGNFINNTSITDGDKSYGGAIYNYENRGETTIGNITGDFIGNYAYATKDNPDSRAQGGAIHNDKAVIGNVEGDFIGNNALATYTFGGAIYNSGDTAQMGNITGDFIKNKAEGEHGEGGAIRNTGKIGDIKGNFYDNKAIANGNNDAKGGAIFNNNEGANISSIEGNFINNTAVSNGQNAQGGAIFNGAQIVTKNENNETISAIKNSNFIGNSAQTFNENSGAKGGAIYTESDLTIMADKGTSVFKDNYTETNGIKDNNAIYVANKTGENGESIKTTLTIESKNEGVFLNEDKISGDSGYNITITGDNTGTVILNNDVEGEADMYLYQTTLKLGKRDDVLKNNNMTFNSGTFDMVNNNIGSTNFNTLTLNDNIKTKADVDLINETMDRITSDNYIINENKLNDKLISVDYLNLLNDSTKDSVKILYADEEISSNVEYIGSNPIQVSKDKIAYSPIYKYTVSYDIDENDNMGYFTFNRGNINDSNSYNPSVLAPSVSSQAGAYTTQLQTFEYAFKHSDAFMALPSFERMAIINADRYALTPTSDATDIGTFSPLMTKLDVSGFWVKPYTSFESIPLNNGPKVSNISYGTLVGYDSNLKHLKNGWERVLTGYIGYNGASQRYSGIDTYQNGGILGLTTTFYKNNFFNATTISTGAAVGDSSTYYGDEDYTMLTAGIGNKFGYNFEFKDGKFILQPNLLLSYTFINTFDYTNAAGLKIKSDPLHALQIAPGIKFIMNTESGWQPYLRADMIWNILDKTKVTANDVRLPEMSIDPYVQYGIGVQKLFKNERLTFFGQALVQNGGRNGVSLNAGLRWAIGKGE